jgi:hypothetical protein
MMMLSSTAFGAAGNITLGENPATIEVTNTDQYTATKTPATSTGVIVNAGSVTVYIHLAAGTVVTTNAQVQNIVSLPAGCSFRIGRLIAAFTYKTAASTSVLHWFPD